MIRDKRKIDRPDADRVAATPAPEVAATPVDDLVAERTADLQRVQAEYANYRKRAARDQLTAGDAAVSRVLLELLPVVDSIEHARLHGDLTGGLKAVADQLDAVLTKVGLVVFGEVGDPFDPALHEAVLHAESDDVTEATCTTIMRPGFKHGERLLRAAMVGVSEPATPPAPAQTAEATEESTQGEAVTPAPPHGDGSEPQGDAETEANSQGPNES